MSYKNVTLPTGKALIQILYDGCSVAFLLSLSSSFLSDYIHLLGLDLH